MYTTPQHKPCILGLRMFCFDPTHTTISFEIVFVYQQSCKSYQKSPQNMLSSGLHILSFEKHPMNHYIRKAAHVSADNTAVCCIKRAHRISCHKG